MALIIEDGTGKADADSYATAAELVDYGTRYGVTVPDTEEEQEALLRQAAVQMNVMKWKGHRANADQALAWPRSNVWIDGQLQPNSYIPSRIQYGQMALAAEIHDNQVNPPDQRQGPVTKEKVDALEVEYGQIENTGKLMWAAPERPSRAQFADFLVTRGLLAVRA